MKTRANIIHRPRAAPMRQTLCRALLAAMVACTAPAWAQQNDAPQAYSIAAGDLASALDQLANQSKVQILYPAELVRGKRAEAISGQQTWRDVLQKLLAGSGLEWGFVNDTTVVIKKGVAAAQPRPASRPAARDTSKTEVDDRIVGMPAIMVEGARTLNMDITRTRDDPQPYVVFDRDLIERSGATTLEQLLQQRLPMNTSVMSVGNATSSDLPTTSSINLRGLGAAQTLILVDGHRMSSPMSAGSLSQGEISGLPLAAIERIEILPSTASGIYGGSATGGVINIITRKDYSGGEVRMTYDNTFSTDSAIRKLDFVFGHNFNQGRTNILVGASYSDANEVVEADRGFSARGRTRIWHNNPDSLMGTWNAPMGRTPNIFSTDGSNLVLKSGAALGASFTSVPSGYAGVATDGGAALLQNAGTYNLELPSGSLGQRRSLYSEPTVKSGTLVLRHSFNDGLQVFADLLSSESQRNYVSSRFEPWVTLPADLPANPFTTEVIATAPIMSDLPQSSLTERDRAVLGVIKKLPADWQLSLDHTWDRTRMSYGGGSAVFDDEFNSIVATQGLDILRDLELFPVDLSQYMVPLYVGVSQSVMRDTTLRVSGPLGNLPAGRPVFSAAVAYRKESIPDFLQSSDPAYHWFYPSRSSSVSSAYMEYRVPLFSEMNARPGLKELELQLAVRREDYASRSAKPVQIVGEIPSPLPEATRGSNDFSSTDPTFALRWRPLRDLALRMSYGTGFVPPSLSQLVVNIPPFLFNATSDPRRGNTPATGFTISVHGNPDLQPEKSKSWSAGLIFTPDAVPGLRLSVDYTRIEKTDNIGEIPGFQQGVIDNEALFPERVVRGPNLPGDPPGWAGPITHVDRTPMNLASAELEAWDLQLDYRMETEARGSFDLFVVGTWQPVYAIQLMDGQPMLDYVGRGASNPLEFKANAGLTWNLSAWRVGWNASYFDSYLASATNATTLANQGNGGKVASQTYHDVFASYDFGLSSGNIPPLLAGTQVQLGVRNIFDQEPPFDASNWPSYFSQFGSPRLASYYLTVTKRF